MQDIGFIGLGVMGLPMARNLAQAGHALRVWNRTPERAQGLAGDGIFHADSAAELAACAVVFVNVADDAAVEAVLFGPSGLLSGDGDLSGRIVVDMGTTSPTYTRDCAGRLAARGVEMLDAPVSGGEAGAIAGSLSIMVGGSLAAFERVRPLFDCLGKNIVHVGATGAGQIAKACNQIVVSATLLGVAEAFRFAERQGVAPARVREALLGGAAYSRILEVHGQRMLEGRYDPGFRSRLHLKDLRIVAAESASVGVEISSLADMLRCLAALVDGGEGDLDSAAVFTRV